jgi:hypothetical protein
MEIFSPTFGELSLRLLDDPKSIMQNFLMYATIATGRMHRLHNFDSFHPRISLTLKKAK